MVYRVKTKDGYYYSTGNGRYGRVNGSKLEAWLLCEKHATEAIEFFNATFPELEAEQERLNGQAPCNRCNASK